MRNKPYKTTLFLGLLFYLLISSCSENQVQPPNTDPPITSIIDSNPTWSSDGNQIAFARENHMTQEYGLYLVDTNGSNIKYLIQGIGISISWSNYGNWIAFSNGGNIFIIKPNGDSLKQLTHEGSNYYPSWSPDGEWIVYDSNKDSPNGMNFIWKMKKDGGSKQRLAYTPTLGETRMPDWGNNNRIIHIRYVGGGSDLPEIFSMNSSGGDVTRITTNTLFEFFPSASPDSNLIMFTSSLDQVKIYTVDYGGGNYIPLTNELSYSSDWSPDGEKIVYCNATMDNGRLWIMNKNGSNKKQLTF